MRNTVLTALLAVCGGSLFAGDDIDSMRATMANMKQEMEAMRATMASERGAMRSNAGGAPESLKSASGKSTVKIGGDLKVRYTAALANTYGAQGGSRYTRTSWDIYEAEINFTIDFTPDTMGYIALRPDRGNQNVGQLLDEAWWRWSNIGGTGFSTKVGLHNLDVGMYGNDNNPWDRVMILDPYTKNTVIAGSFPAKLENLTDADAGSYISGLGTTAHETNFNALGVSVDYKWDQIMVTAGVFGQQVAQDNGMDNTLGVTNNGTARNIDVENHYITGKYDPCWLEGLHTQASYFGTLDQGAGVPATWLPSNYAPYNRTNLGATYTPGVDFGISYTADKWAIYGESAIITNPAFIDKSYTLACSIGADYSLTDKLKVGGSFDWNNTALSKIVPAGSNVSAQLLRAGLGAKYDFGNGLYVQAQYSHQWMTGWGVGDSNGKDSDSVALQTGFKF